MKKYKIPKIEVHPYPPRDYYLENQSMIMIAYIVGGSPPMASYVYKKNNNKVMLFLDGILYSAKFRSMKLVEKIAESISHEIFHSHVWQEFRRHFVGEERFAHKFADFSKPPEPFTTKPNRKCSSCGKETYWKRCEKCSIDEIAT